MARRLHPPAQPPVLRGRSRPHRAARGQVRADCARLHVREEHVEGEALPAPSVRAQTDRAKSPASQAYFVYDVIQRTRRRGKKLYSTCSLGFHAGHSAILLMESVPEATLYEARGDLAEIYPRDVCGVTSMWLARRSSRSTYRTSRRAIRTSRTGPCSRICTASGSATGQSAPCHQRIAHFIPAWAFLPRPGHRACVHDAHAPHPRKSNYERKVKDDTAYSSIAVAQLREEKARLHR